MSNNQTFSLGITYRPPQRIRAATNLYGWNAIDSGATRDQLAHIAELGCDTLRLCLLWEDFQPGPMRIGSTAMRALERVLDSALEARLQVVAVLFAGAMGGAVQVPFWVTGISPGVDLALTRHFGPLLISAEGQGEILFEGDYHATPVRDIYRDKEQLSAQRYLIDEVIGYFATHPAIAAWQLGYELNRVRTASSVEAAYEWFAGLVEHARERGATRLLGASSPHALTRQDTLRPQHLAEFCASVAVQVHPYEPLRVTQPWQTDYVAFLHALMQTLVGSARPVIVADVGLATQPEGRAAWVAHSPFGQNGHAYLADEEQQATFLENALTRLYQAGAAGVWLASYADLAVDQWATPPFDRAIRERTLGLMRADGREKQAAAALRAFALRLRQGTMGTPGSATSLDIDSEQYWRAPAKELRRLYQEWTTNQ